MNKTFLHSKKFRHGSVSVALTVLIVAAVILFNAVFTALANKYLWQLDMTAEQIFTLSDAAKELMRGVERDVTIIFCAPRDKLEETEATRYPLYTALQLQDQFEHVKVRFVDWSVNPSAVAKYKETSGQNINSSSIIIASGTGDPADPREESRVYTVSNLFTLNTAGSSYNGYCGEQKLVSAILAVTQIDLPVAGIVTNHGEGDSLTENDRAQLLTLLHETGYEVKELNLTRDAIPEDCRLLVMYGPTSDLVEMGTVSEINKIEAFLDAGNAMMVFFDYTTPKLPLFEEFLEKWGVTVCRSESGADYLLRDLDHSYTPQGYTIVGDYITDGEGLGSQITAPLWKDVARPKDVVFPYATAIGVPESYTALKSGEDGYWLYQLTRDGLSRDRYDVFCTYGSAEAYAGGDKVTGARAPFTTMTVTQETKIVEEREIKSYVVAVSSLDFTSGGALVSSYGNHSVLTYTCSLLGRAYAPISLDTKYFNNTDISTIDSKAANQYTIVLTAVPAGAVFLAGIYLMVRRKYR